MPRKRNLNNTVVGLFLILSLALAVGASIVLSDISFASQSKYIVRFSLADGAAGLKNGSAVAIGGQQVGSVGRIDFAIDPQTGVPTAVDVTIRMRADLTLYQDASANLELPLLGTLGVVNITSVGTPAAGPLAEEGVLDGGIAPPSFLAQAGFGPEQRDALVGILEDASLAVGRLRETIERVDPQIDPAIASAQEAIDSLRATFGDVRERVPGWSDSVDASLANVETFTEELDVLGVEAEGALQQIRVAASDVSATVEENRPRLDAIASNLESASGKLDAETIPLANGLIATTQTEIEQAGAAREEITDEIARFLAAELPSARRIMASGRLAADQLRLATTEIRAQPWRLLVRPDRKQLGEQLVYDSARTYAAAVGDLRAASEALDAVLARSANLEDGLDAGLDTASVQQIQTLRAELSDAYERYDQAERDLLDRLLQDNAPR